MPTMLEWVQEEIERLRQWMEKNGQLPPYNRQRLTELEVEVEWYETNEVRPCWTVENLFDRPVIYVEDGAWNDWLDTLDIDEEWRESITVTEGTITGREAGDLDYYEP
jgi:hypothetical protein